MRSTRLLALLVSCSSSAHSLNLSESYAPVTVHCPKYATLTRPASEGLHPDEETWLHNRKKVVAGALSNYLTNAKLKDFDIDQYISALNKTSFDAVPGIGVAVSGGGYASAIMGAGVLRALDGREKVSTDAGTGGLLQALSFLSGQSGGSWLVSSYTSAEYPLSEELLQYWQPQLNRLTATKNETHAATIASIGEDIAAKAKAGFNVSVADFLGRLNGYEFVKGDRGGLNVTLSGIKDLATFKNHEMPLPIIQVTQVTDQDPKQLGLSVPTLKSPIYEFTPYEFGTWMEPVQNFMDIGYLGTKMLDGRPASSSACVRGYDRLPFIMGASANAYTFWWLENHSNGTLGQFPKRSLVEDVDSQSQSHPQNVNLRKRLEETFPAQEVEALGKTFKEYFGLDLPDYAYTPVPNPWRNKSTAASEDQLTLVDATEVASSLPFAGQLARNASFIIAWDDNTDAWPNGWQNGTDMYQAYLYFKENNIPFPIVPSPSTFIAQNYTIKPAFFGCDAHLTTTKDTRAPIIAWFGNAPYSSYSNMTFFQNVTPIPRVLDIWNNTFNQISQGAGSLDAEWSACLACAAIDRSLEKVNPPIQRSKQCQSCFDRYCWDGKSAPEYAGQVDVDPTLLLNKSVTYAEWNRTVGQHLQ